MWLIGLKGELTSRLLMKINEQGLNVIDSIFEQKKIENCPCLV